MDAGTAALVGGIGGGIAGGTIALVASSLERRHRHAEDRVTATRVAGAALEGRVRHLMLRVRLMGEVYAHPVMSAVRSPSGAEVRAVHMAAVDCLGPIAEARSAFEAVAPEELRPLSDKLLDTTTVFVQFVEETRPLRSDDIQRELQGVADVADEFRLALRVATKPAALRRRQRAALTKVRSHQTVDTGDTKSLE